MKRNKVIFGLSLIALGLILGTIAYFQKERPIENAARTSVAFHPDDVALVLIDAMGDNDTIKQGSVTAECLSAKVDGVSDQYDLLLRTIANNPGTTHYIDGLYATLMPGSRRPIFQIRLPDRKYCSPFVTAYRACFAKAEPESEVDRLILPSGRCIKEAAKSLDVKENWSDLIEKYGPKETPPKE